MAKVLLGSNLSVCKKSPNFELIFLCYGHGVTLTLKSQMAIAINRHIEANCELSLIVDLFGRSNVRGSEEWIVYTVNSQTVAGAYFVQLWKVAGLYLKQA